jgi:hypothetical protein
MNNRVREWCVGIVALAAIAVALPVIVRESRVVSQENARAENAPSTQEANVQQSTPSENAPRVVAAPPRSVPPANSTATPTESDRQLLARYNLLLKELGRPQSPTLDWIHTLRDERNTEAVQTLESRGAVDARTLAQSRRYIQWMVTQFERARKIPTPWPAVVLQRRSPIQIDGKLDEPDWKRAREVFIQYDRREKATGLFARARLLWDEKFLYVAFTVPDKAIVAPLLERDGEVWKYDCVEVFLMPSRRFNTYWELELSPTGSILDYLCYKYPDRWGSDMRTDETMKGLQVGQLIRGTANKSGDVDEGYTMEIAVPFDELPNFPRNPKAGDKFYGLLCWINRDSQEQERTSTQAQVPFITWFHNVWAYQPFVLSDKAK